MKVGGAMYEEPTPVEKHGDYWIKRDDLFEINGVQGGKVRACWRMVLGARGMVCASSRFSPQASIVARVAEHCDLPAIAHIPTGDETPEMRDAKNHGIKFRRESPGYKSVLVARARADADRRKWKFVPWGMESEEQIVGTANEVRNLPRKGPKRLVVVVAYGMSLAGILQGYRLCGVRLPVLGVCVSNDPSPRLDRWAPPDWRKQVKLVRSALPYHEHAPDTHFQGIRLDPIYEGKVVPFLKPGDLFWIIGCRPKEALL